MRRKFQRRLARWRQEQFTRIVAGCSARQDIARLTPRGSVGIELGVAEGMFSARLLETGRFSHLYSVDMWAGDRGHDVKQYRKAVAALMPFRGRSTVLKMRFDEALPLFPDSYFDFIYIDGYAHTGQEQGQTLRDWWPKLKPGGIFAGDDYDPRWPLVIASVDKFMNAHDLPRALLKPATVADPWSKFPSWVTKKPLHAGPKIALVGNGPIDPKLSSDIDAHDFVVRINKAPSAGIAGLRTDALVVFNAGTPGRKLSQPEADINPQALSEAREIWLPANRDEIARLRPDIQDYTEAIKERLSGFRYVNFPDGSLRRAIKELREHGANDETPSTGALALWHILGNMHPSVVTLYGFTHEGWRGHPWQAEKSWVDGHPLVVRASS